MHRPKRWKINPPHPAAQELAEKLKVSVILAGALLSRGVTSPAEAQAFLRPSLMQLADPAALPGLEAAAQRIARAIREKQKIVIYGDYDVDGITATAILWHAITLLGGEVCTYIPHRIDEGYGLNSDALAQIIADGAKLIVTVDCGITAMEPAKIARQRGVDLIITDHHDWREGEEAVLPDCFAIVHPRLPAQAPYANPHLCGAGVAFKLAWGIGKEIAGSSRVSESFRDFLVDATALAALGTIADVVPLVGENRIIASFGLGGLKQSRLLGLRALIASAGLSGQNLDSYHVGFLLGPRLNACGRLGHAQLAVEMLTTAGEARAAEIANYLEEQNRNRQTVERAIFAQASDLIEQNRWDQEQHRAIVLGAEGWHAGVIGIVASRLVERFCRPTVMVALTNGQGQGSARSVSGFHLAKALDACHEHLLAHGGHEMAAGLRLETPKLNGFREAFCAVAASRVTEEMLRPQLRLECVTELSEISQGLVQQLQRLGPFGRENPRPLLCLKDLVVAGQPRRVGKNADHLQLLARQNNRTMKCICFGGGELADQLPVGARFDAAVEPCLNEFNGLVNVELEIKDVQLAASAH